MCKRIEAALLMKNGGNQSEMARYVGVTPQAVQKWIAGDSEPKGKNLKLAAEFLGMSEAVLRYGDSSGKIPAAPKLQQVRSDYNTDMPSADEVAELVNNFVKIKSAKTRRMIAKSTADAARLQSTGKASVADDKR